MTGIDLTEVYEDLMDNEEARHAALRARLLRSRFRDACEAHDRGEDPFERIYTKQLLEEWRHWASFGYVETRSHPALTKRENHDMEAFEHRYYELLKAELDKRPHVPNKAEAKKIRQEKAKSGGRGNHRKR